MYPESSGPILCPWVSSPPFSGAHPQLLTGQALEPSSWGGGGLPAGAQVHVHVCGSVTGLSMLCSCDGFGWVLIFPCSCSSDLPRGSPFGWTIGIGGGSSSSQLSSASRNNLSSAFRMAAFSLSMGRFQTCRWHVCGRHRRSVSCPQAVVLPLVTCCLWRHLPCLARPLFPGAPRQVATYGPHASPPGSHLPSQRASHPQERLVIALTAVG